MSADGATRERPELIVLLTPVGGRLLEADLSLQSLSASYRVTLLCRAWRGLERPPAFALRHPLWLRTLLRRGQPRLLCILRADSPEAHEPLLLSQRYRAAVLLSGGGLLQAYRSLYLLRDDAADFAAELGRQLGGAAPAALQRALAGLPCTAAQETAPLVRTLAHTALGIATTDRAAFQELEAIGAPNRNLVLPAAYELERTAALPRMPGFVLTLLGEAFPDPLMDAVAEARRELASSAVQLSVVLAGLGQQPPRPLPEGFLRLAPSQALLGASDAVLPVPEAPRTWLSSAAATALRAGAVTLAPDPGHQPALAGCTVPLRTFPSCAGELRRAIEALQRSQELGQRLRTAARHAGAKFPDPAQLARELGGLLERWQFQRSPQVDPLRVWNDVLGVRATELRGLCLHSHEAEALEALSAAQQLQRITGGDD
jgi:hypothetical protein